MLPQLDGLALSDRGRFAGWWRAIRAGVSSSWRGPGGAGMLRTGQAPPAGWVEFDRYFRHAFPRVVAQQHAILCDRDRAHTVAYEAFARAWLSWSEVRALADRTAWVRRQAAKQVRRSDRLRMVTAPPWRSPGPSRSSIMILDALAQMPAVQRRALVLHYMAGLSFDELAAEEHTSVESIQTRLAHGQLALGHRLASSGQADGDTDIRDGQWATGPIGDWVARQLTYLEYRLAPRPDSKPVLAVSGAVARRRRIAIGAVAVLMVLGAAVACLLSPSTAEDTSLAPPGQMAPVLTPAAAPPELMHGPVPGDDPDAVSRLTGPGWTALLPDNEPPHTR